MLFSVLWPCLITFLTCFPTCTVFHWQKSLFPNGLILKQLFIMCLTSCFSVLPQCYIYTCSNFRWWCNVSLFLFYIFYKVCDGITRVIKHVKQRGSGMILAACFFVSGEMKWKQVFQAMEHLQHLQLTIASLCRIVWHHVESHVPSFLFQAVACGWNLAFTEHRIVDLVPKGVQQAHITVLLIMQLTAKTQLILQDVIHMSITKWTVVVLSHRTACYVWFVAIDNV